MTTDIRFYRANERPYGAFSNLYRCRVEFEGVFYQSAEHAYQAGKPRDALVRDWLLAAPTPALLAKAAHQLTRAWEVVPGWSRGRVDRMRKVLRAKFNPHSDFRALLVGTGKARLVEAGTIDDQAGRFWGEVNGHGKNTLGVLLMELRDQLARQVP